MKIVRAAALLVLAAATPELASAPLSRLDLPWWRERFEAKKSELTPGVQLVWYGDSITQNWEKTGPEPWRDFRPIWNRFYARRHAIDLGFKGDTTAHLLWRIEHGEAEGIHPKLAIVLIGANNFGKLHWPAESTFRGIETVVAALHARLPTTAIILLGVLPAIRGPWVDAQTRAVNRLLAARYAASPTITFRDLTALFVKNGRTDPTRFYDALLTPPDPPLHPNPAAMADIAQAIEPDVARIMGK